MSTLKTDGIQAATGTNTDLTLAGKGTGVPDLAAGFKVGSVAGVPTASIQDDAITLAKLASGTDGELITWDASGDPAAVAVGTATHVLTSNGAGAAPTFQAAGGGAWVLIGTQTASTSASLTQTGLDATYDTYVIILSHFVPVSGYAKLYLRLGTSSGILTAGNYEYGSIERSSYQAISVGRTYTYTSLFFPLTVGLAGDIPNASGEGANSTIYLTNKPFDSSTEPQVQAATTYSDATWSTISRFDGRYSVNSAIDRVQVYFSTGNISVGRMTVWGISHA